MSGNLITIDDDWVPSACTLPSVEQPLRRDEFDELFSQDVLTIAQTSPHEVRLALRADPEVASRAARLAAQESNCCSFFAFELTITSDEIALVVSTPPAQAAVLAALAARVQTMLGSVTS